MNFNIFQTLQYFNLDQLKHSYKDQDVWQLLQKSVTALDAKGRFCLLLFDEYRLRILDTNKVAENPPTHGVSFILRGINDSWMQPIVNFLWRRENGAIFLAQMIEDAIKTGFRVGLTIVALVCDHCEMNVRAIEILQTKFPAPKSPINENCEQFMVNNNLITQIYDPLRLLIGFRNVFMKNQLIYETEDNNKKIVTSTAKWLHVYRTYCLDLRTSKKLTSTLNHHSVNPYRVDKRSASPAIRVFSYTMSECLREFIAKRQLPEDATATENLIFFLDKLFDSLNGDPKPLQKVRPTQPEKLLRKPLNNKSAHFAFWLDAEKRLDSMRFVKQNNGQVFRGECLDKWVTSIHGMREIWKRLRKAKLREMWTRRFNLEIIEYMLQSLRNIKQYNIPVAGEIPQDRVLNVPVMALVMMTNLGNFEIV